MRKLNIFYAVSVFLSVAAGIMMMYAPQNFSNSPEEFSETFTPSKNQFDWKAVITNVSQFAPQEKNETVTTIEKAENIQIDPNDISAIKLIGLIPDNKTLAIVLVPVVDAEKSSIDYETLNVTLGSSILDGWVLSDVGATTATWQHHASNTSHTHRLFEPHS
ncbi:hypothetical protein [Agaribacter flavus]|uniref:Uncharacterized protein n=1 Tax=Agaribacter flavus TaxID=1902781 RepID=A0ABV7FRA0_9ALTE